MVGGSGVCICHRIPAKIGLSNVEKINVGRLEEVFEKGESRIVG
jgi:hypothetical protein